MRSSNLVEPPVVLGACFLLWLPYVSKIHYHNNYSLQECVSKLQQL